MKTMKVTLLGPVNHAGELHGEGDVLTLSVADAKALIEAKAAVEGEPEPEPAPTPAPTSAPTK